ncbi:MAG: hypothetical protein KBC60_10130, partial [Haliscomenobacter sp.]|nr:hypothetical protein [Haliscomenobacter sp.]
MPTPENLGQLVAHAYKIERLAGVSLDYVSGGASSSLQLLLDGVLPAGINNLRVGEAILQGGIETFREKPWEALEFDAARLTADVIEVKKKPSRPIGVSGYDAFGNQPYFPDEGDRLRGTQVACGVLCRRGVAHLREKRLHLHMFAAHRLGGPAAR